MGTVVDRAMHHLGDPCRERSRGPPAELVGDAARVAPLFGGIAGAQQGGIHAHIPIPVIHADGCESGCHEVSYRPALSAGYHPVVCVRCVSNGDEGQGHVTSERPISSRLEIPQGQFRGVSKVDVGNARHNATGDEVGGAER